jgi:hypothetical protein
MTIASKLKLLRMQEKFSHVPKDIVAQTYQACQENLEQAELTLSEFYGLAEPSAAIEAVPVVVKPIDTKTLPKKGIYSSVPQLWVETGSSMAELYEEYRTAAIDHGIHIRKYFLIYDSFDEKQIFHTCYTRIPIVK